MGEIWNIIRIGEVEAVDTVSARVKVTFEEMSLTSDWIPVIQRGAGSAKDYFLPGIGEHVVCIFYSDGTEEGICLGSYYPVGSKPPSSGSGVYYTIFPDTSSVKWDNGKLTIVAHAGVEITAESVISGNVTINGNVIVNGTVTAQQFVDV